MLRAPAPKQYEARHGALVQMRSEPGRRSRVIASGPAVPPAAALQARVLALRGEGR